MITTPEQAARLLCVHRAGKEGGPVCCVANSCQAWRWANAFTGTFGYCGLAGPVEVHRLQCGQHPPYGHRATLLAPNDRTVPFPGASELPPNDQRAALLRSGALKPDMLDTRFPVAAKQPAEDF